MLSKIVVHGHGEARAKPDVAEVRATVTFLHQDASTAHQLMDEATARVLARLEELGLARDNVQTRYYSVRPEYQRKKNSDVMTGYRARNALEVTTSDISLVTRITEALMSAGATEINSVGFRCSEDVTESLQREALRKATVDAADRAGAMAQALDAKVGRVLSVSDETARSNLGFCVREVAVYGPEHESAQPPEEITIESEVEAVFEIGQRS